jgi:hypothetical protein
VGRPRTDHLYAVPLTQIRRLPFWGMLIAGNPDI